MNELIRKHLDGRATPEEIAALARLLATSPDSADAYARACRMETWISEYVRDAGAAGREREILASTSRRSWGYLAACAAVAIAFVVWIVVQRPAPSVSSDPRVISGQVVVEGEDIRVVGAEPAIVRLNDGSNVVLEPATSATLHGRMAGLRQVVELKEGSGLFRVKEGEGEFQVETEAGRVTALGTEFRVGLVPDKKKRPQLAVAVLEGWVQVDVEGKSYVVAEGESRLFGPRGDQKGPKEIRRVVVALRELALTVTDGKDRPSEATFAIPPDVRVLVDGRTATLPDLKPGMIVYLQRWPGEPPIVGIRAEGPVVPALLKSLTDQTVTVALKRKQERTYPLTPGAEIFIDGAEGDPSDLKPGQGVSLTLSTDGERVIRIAQRKK